MLPPVVQPLWQLGLQAGLQQLWQAKIRSSRPTWLRQPVWQEGLHPVSQPHFGGQAGWHTSTPHFGAQ
jgi:hypothetical protein